MMYVNGNVENPSVRHAVNVDLTLVDKVDDNSISKGYQLSSIWLSEM